MFPVVTEQRLEAGTAAVHLVAVVVVQITRSQLAVQGEVPRGVGKGDLEPLRQVMPSKLTTETGQKVDLPEAFALAG